MITITTLSESATIHNADGYVQQTGVHVCDLGDTITIGATEHNKSDLTITADTITSISNLGLAILREAESYTEPASFQSVGFYFCRAKTERNAAYPIHVLMCDGQWRDAHRRQRALVDLGYRRPMTSAEKDDAASSERLISFRYKGLLPLLEDEWRTTTDVRHVGILLTCFAYRGITDYEDAQAFVRSIQPQTRRAVKP